VFSFICGSKKKVGLIEVENRVVIRRSWEWQEGGEDRDVNKQKYS
jgi:hypothetical protein